MALPAGGGMGSTGPEAGRPSGPQYGDAQAQPPAPGRFGDNAAAGQFGGGQAPGRFGENPAAGRFGDNAGPGRFGEGQAPGRFAEGGQAGGRFGDGQGQAAGRFGEGPMGGRFSENPGPGQYPAAGPGNFGPGNPGQAPYGQFPPGQPGSQGQGVTDSGFSQAQHEQGPYSGPQSAVPPSVPPPAAVSLSDAVQAAHAEGFGFGDAVARDAPALWLEAVLARKPRMPSDLEARLLQGSALPIDSLLHDEVRHSLRRGFWDALERSRR